MQRQGTAECPAGTVHQRGGQRVLWGMALTPAPLFFSPVPAFSSCAQVKARSVSFLVSQSAEGETLWRPPVPAPWKSQLFLRAAPTCQQQISQILQKFCFQPSPHTHVHAQYLFLPWQKEPVLTDNSVCWHQQWQCRWCSRAVTPGRGQGPRCGLRGGLSSLGLLCTNVPSLSSFSLSLPVLSAPCSPIPNARSCLVLGLILPLRKDKYSPSVW